MDKNTKIVVFASVVVVALIAAGMMFSSSITGAAIEGCIDLDGDNPNVASQVKVGMDDGSKPDIYYDKCSGAELVEMICLDDLQTTKTYTCPSGCAGGACA